MNVDYDRCFWKCLRCGERMRIVEISRDKYELVCDKCDNIEDKLMKRKFKR